MKTKSRRFRKLLLCVTPLAALVASFASPRPAQAVDYDACYELCSDIQSMVLFVCGEITDDESANQCIDSANDNYEVCIDDCEVIHGGGGDQCGPNEFGCDPFYDF